MAGRIVQSDFKRVLTELIESTIDNGSRERENLLMLVSLVLPQNQTLPMRTIHTVNNWQSIISTAGALVVVTV